MILHSNAFGCRGFLGCMTIEKLPESDWTVHFGLTVRMNLFIFLYIYTTYPNYYKDVYVYIYIYICIDYSVFICWCSNLVTILH